MDLSLSDSEARFEREFSDWVRANLRDEWTARRTRLLPADESWAARREWERLLGSGGWLGVSWPVEYGGRGATLMELAIYYEVLAKADAPSLPNSAGQQYIGPTILEVGTAEQQSRYLAPIIQGDEVWYQGFSEPNAGSDLAGLQTRATLDGDEWVLNGQKIWGNSAQYADWGAVLVRTDPEAPKHRGISYLIVDMRSPGITVREIKQINGEAEFNEVFFDDVRVPRDNVLGNVNEGWQVAMRTLAWERGLFTLSVVVRLERQWQQIRGYAQVTRRAGKLLIEVPHIRERLASTYADVQLMRLANLRYLTWYLRGNLPAEETSYMKFYWSETAQNIADLAADIAGPELAAMTESPAWLDDGEWTSDWLASRVITVPGGTVDIQRNIIAERAFGLPRGT